MKKYIVSIDIDSLYIDSLITRWSVSTVKSKNVKFYTLAKSYIQFPAKVYFKKGGIIALKLKNFKVSGNLRRRFFLIHFHSIGIDMLD